MLSKFFKQQSLQQLAYSSIVELVTDDGINASSKEEIYGCIFGRDSAITILKILKANKNLRSPELLNISKKALSTLVLLQGKELNLESGEELGKFIHEFRRENFKHLVSLSKPWYVYPDNTLRNYDSLDSTPLTLIAIYKYWEASQDHNFLITALPAVEAGLNWIITFGDKDKDFLIEYELPKERVHGGLAVQSWTDSHESLLQSNGKMPKYPIAPVEAQGYAWLALKLWGSFYIKHSPDFAQKLLSQAKALKERFNKSFVMKDNNLYFAAQALDGNKNMVKTVTGNPLLLLWATFDNGKTKECILDNKYTHDLVSRGFQDDLFDPDAGIRTMSTKAKTFNPEENSYHNGSFWPVLNGMIYEGLLNWDFKKEAKQLKKSSLKPLKYFGSPIELYVKDKNGKYLEYRNASGQVGCRVQAWSAASLLDFTTEKRGLLDHANLSHIFTLISFNKHRFAEINPLNIPPFKFLKR
jgi:glycogen debranching enzyme